MQTSFSSEAEGWQRWLVVRQSISSGAKPPDQAFFLIFARAGTPLIEMVEAFGGRWRIEQCFEVGKSEGSETCHHEGTEDSTEGTTPTSEQTQDQQEQPQVNVDVPVMVPLTLPEVRRLFYSLVEMTPFSSLYRLTWSYWRRTLQAVARLCHYKRRIAMQLQL